MTPERWAHVQEIFHNVLERDLTEREAFLADACGSDDDLRHEVVSLLDAHDGKGLIDTIVGQRPPLTALPTTEIDGQYRILRSLGEGGMGTVYLAERQGADFTQNVALKLMREGFVDATLQERFRTEQRILARLEHPGIARLIDGGTTETGQPYYAMEYVAGTNVVDYCDHNRLSVTQRLRLFLDICDPVQYAHQQLVVHRDLKPSNILVSDRGRARLLDFGIAKIIHTTEDRDGVHRTGAWFTPAYASPEQVRGEEASTLSDVYALGVLLYELLTGHRPYVIDSGAASEIQRIVCEQVPDRPSSVVTRPAAISAAQGTAVERRPEELSAVRSSTPERLRKRVSGDLDAIVLRALAKEATERYPSVQQLADDVRRHLEGKPVSARPDTVAYRMRRFVRRHRALVTSTVALVSVLVAYGATVTVQNRRVGRALEQARIEADRSSQLTDLLIGLFESPSPGLTGADSLTAHELLDQGLERVQQMDGRPAAQAQMLHALGSVHRHLGEYGEAAPLFERALELRRRIHGADHQNVAESLVALADVYRVLNRLEEAEALLREALAMERDLVGDEHRLVARTMSELSLTLRDAGDYEEAEPLAREALAMRRRLLGDKHQDVAESVNYLAALLRRMGDYAASEPLYREALTMRQRLYGGDHPEIAESLNNLAVQLDEMGDYGAAEPRYRQALAMYRRLFGENHPFVATAMGNLGILLARMERLDEAEELYRGALAVRRRVYGEEHPEVASGLFLIGSLLRRRQDYEAAEPYYRQVLEMRRKLLGEEHPAYIGILQGYGGLLREKGERNRAEPYFRQALEIGRRTLGNDHPSTATSLVGLGIVLRLKGDRPGAEDHLVEALEIRRQLLGDGHRFVTAVARELVVLYEDWNRPEQVDRYRPLTVER
jgi:serine/threonine-protein kinase